MVPVEKCGYYEDRRPASNLDAYVVCKLLVETTLLM
jgi:glutamine synthetase